MRTLPFLLITLHFSQIGFTDDLTFTSNPPFIHCSAYMSDAYRAPDAIHIHLLTGIFLQMPRNALIYYSTACQTKSIDNFIFLSLSVRYRQQSKLVPARFYLSLQIILPLDRSYGDNSNVTLSPGRILMKFILNLPLICASTWCPFSNSTWNIAFGNFSTTVPSISITSAFYIFIPPSFL